MERIYSKFGNSNIHVQLNSNKSKPKIIRAWEMWEQRDCMPSPSSMGHNSNCFWYAAFLIMS